MAKNIEPTLRLINSYLKLESQGKSDPTRHFVIPEYQRGYSWSITQCDKLWQDIEAFSESGGNDPYFFGTIIVDLSEENKFSLIDGQQRTTTFLLLLKALLLHINSAINTIPDDEESEALKAGLKSKRNDIMKTLYKLEDEDIPAVLKDFSKVKDVILIENNSINELYEDDVNAVLSAEDYEEAERSVHKIPRKQKDNKYTNQFRNFKYFYTQLGEKNPSQLNKFAKIFLEECQIIEIRSWQVEQAITMFNSLNSTGLPLSDADIISAQLYSNAGDSKESFNAQWERLNELSSNLSAQGIVDLTAVLTQYMYINRARVKEYVLSSTGNFDVTVPGLRKYFIDHNKELLKNPAALSSEFIKIAEIWDYIKEYPVVKLLLKFNENAKLYLSAYLSRYDAEDITPEMTLDICHYLIRLFTILELVDAGYSSAAFKTFLFGQAIKLVDNDVALSDIHNDFNNHIQKAWSKDDIVLSLKEYDKNILVFLNDYLYSLDRGLDFDFAESTNVEHIMPASGANIGHIRKDAGIEDEVEFDNLVNQLGNKILLEEDINKSIGNEWFKTKKYSNIEDRSGYNNSKYGIASALTGYPKDRWEKDDIERATEKASERIARFIFAFEESQNVATDEDLAKIAELRAKGLIS